MLETAIAEISLAVNTLWNRGKFLIYSGNSKEIAC
jgi:hypothetical protein